MNDLITVRTLTDRGQTSLEIATAVAGFLKVRRNSGDANAENVVELRDGGLAERLAAYVDTVRLCYGRAEVAAATPAQTNRAVP
jgi:hypothetical protein